MRAGERIAPKSAAVVTGHQRGALRLCHAGADGEAAGERLGGRDDIGLDPEVVKADFKRAGFVFAGESALLRNRADDHSLLVFDPKIRGATDRFIFKFKKPR